MLLCFVLRATWLQVSLWTQDAEQLVSRTLYTAFKVFGAFRSMVRRAARICKESGKNVPGTWWMRAPGSWIFLWNLIERCRVFYTSRRFAWKIHWSKAENMKRGDHVCDLHVLVGSAVYMAVLELLLGSTCTNFEVQKRTMCVPWRAESCLSL